MPNIGNSPVKHSLKAVVNISSSGDNTIITGVSGKRIKISTLFFIVEGDVSITLYNGATAISGPMSFGGTNEPKGIISNYGDAPLKITQGNSFVVNLSAAVQVSGQVCYSLE